MKFIVINHSGGRRLASVSNTLLVGLALAGLVLPMLAGYLGYLIGVGDVELTRDLVTRWRATLVNQGATVANVRVEVENKLEASALRVAQLQARMLRLDALGERLAEIGSLEGGEFDFSRQPAMGGPIQPADVSSDELPAFVELLDQLALDIEDRELQLDVLESLLVNRKMQRDVFVAGRPVQTGWMSSAFGYRIDPVTGRRSFHNGVDFAGQYGSGVTAVATGVVQFAGIRNGYGKMIEINHGGGYSTRYGHHQELKVQPGDIVRKGDVIGLMGSTGRSTGPHVHFEVFKNGRIVDPSAYIHRASR